MDYNDTRKMLRYMRGKEKPQNQTNESPEKKELSVRDMLSITRHKRINESQLPIDVPELDQKTEEEKMNNAFREFQVSIEYDDLVLFRNAVAFSGKIDEKIGFLFTVSPDEDQSKSSYEFTEDFDDSNPENQKVINKLDSYYDEFYVYWRDEKL